MNENEKMLMRMNNLARARRESDAELDGPLPVAVLDEERGAIPLERVVCPDLAFVGRKWLEMPRLPGEALPRWSAFRLTEFVAVIDRLCVLLAQEGDADRMEFTVCGQHVTDFIGGGRPLSLAAMLEEPRHRANYADIRDRAARTIAGQAPEYARKTLSWRGFEHMEYEVLMLPFMPEGGVQRILQPASSWIMKPGPVL